MLKSRRRNPRRGYPDQQPRKTGWRNNCQQILNSSWKSSHCQNLQPMDKKSLYSSPIVSRVTTSFLCDCCKKSICSSSGYVIRRLVCGNTITCKTCYQRLGSSLTYVLNNPEIYIFRCIYCRKERGSNNYTNMCSCCSEKILGTSLMDCINNSEKY